MLQINAKVITYDGSSVATGTVVAFNPNFPQMTEVLSPKEFAPSKPGERPAEKPQTIIGYQLPCSLLFYVSLAIYNDSYRNIVPIVDAIARQTIDIANIVLTPAQANNPTKAVIEGYLKTYLEKIYGAGTVVILD